MNRTASAAITLVVLTVTGAASAGDVMLDTTATLAQAAQPPALSVSDLFTTRTVAAITLSATPTERELLDAFAFVEEELRARRAERALPIATRAMAVLDSRDPRWVEAVYYRAAAADLLDDRTALRALKKTYEEFAPNGPRMRWFHERVAIVSEREGDWRAAADSWEAAIAALPKGVRLGTEEALHAVESFGREARPKQLRTAAAMLEGVELSPPRRAAVDRWIADSLLLEDDEARPLPADGIGLDAPTLLRYTMLARLRKDRAAERTLCAALEPRLAELSAPERELWSKLP